MIESSEILAGRKLKTTRLRLLLTRKDVYECTGIPTTTCERIENGDLPYPAHRFHNLVSFYDYTMEEIYSKKEVPDWIELRRRFLSKHRNNSDVLSKINEKPNPKEAILYRVLTSKILDDFISVSDLTKKIKSTYNWSFDQDKLHNALDSIEKEELIIKSKDTQYKYKRASDKLPEEIDRFFATTRKLEKTLSTRADHLVNPAFRRMAIIIENLVDGEKRRSELMEVAGLRNDSNNIYRTIKILEEMTFVEKTEELARSSNQKYRLTEKGIQFLKDLGIS